MPEVMQPGPLADSDISALKEILLEIAVEFILHGIYSALVMIALYKLWTKKTQSAARHILIAASISMFAASTTQISLDLAHYLIQLPVLGFNPPNVGRSLINMEIFIATMTRLNYLMGDSTVVWRAWVLWTNHPRFSNSPRFSSLIPRALIVFLPLFLTNLISTLLIAYKVWEYKVKIKQNLGLSHNKRTKVERVLILLTESGSIYCLLWAIYPIILILLLAFSKANLEPTVNETSFSQPLQFASRPQVHAAAQSDDVTPDSMTSHIASVMPDPDADDRPDPATNDRLDPTTDNRPDSNTNDIVVEKANLESTVAGSSFSQSLQFASRHQVPTATQSDDVAPDSTTSHINSVMPDSDADDRSDPATDDRLDPTMDNRPNSKTNDIAVAESLGENMEEHGSSHLG
ncbi:hypothetical protein C8J56DRAFT_887042 [Mycena floridula]|nr:hypothetical protein C8J56DRAFT_887042 [Mycena floridula]